MIEIDFEVTGLDELERNMDAFGPMISRDICTEGIQAAAAYLASLAQSHAPVIVKSFGSREPGELRGSIGVVMKEIHPDHPENTGAYVGPLYLKSGDDQDPGYWGQYVEYGSVHNEIPEPYLRPALDEGGQRAIDVFVAVASEKFDEMNGTGWLEGESQ
jgi:hypothetical protein